MIVLYIFLAVCLAAIGFVLVMMIIATKDMLFPDPEEMVYQRNYDYWLAVKNKAEEDGDEQHASYALEFVNKYSRFIRECQVRRELDAEKGVRS